MQTNLTPRRMKSMVVKSIVLSMVVFVMLPAANAAFLTGTSPLGSSQTIFTVIPIPGGTPAGALLASLLSPYAFATTAGTTSGTLLSAVYLNPSGTLDFYYQVANSANSATAIARETDTSFAGFATQAGFRIDAIGPFTAGTVAPITADKNAGGTVVGFQFNPPDGAKILPGTTSNTLVISTLATQFTAGNAAVIDGGTQTVAAFQPLAGVPEPATFGMIGAGLLALAGIRRMRRN